MDTKWIGPGPYPCELEVGKKGFLIKCYGNDWERWEFDNRPAKTNITREEKLEGECGSNSYSSTTAFGMWRVSRVAKNGRAFICKLKGQELAAALEEFGYPNLVTNFSK